MTDHDRTRRRFLHQALGAGCVLAIPVVLSGCDNVSNPAVTESYDGSDSDDGASADSRDSTDTGSNGSGSQSTDQATADSQPVKVSQADAAYQGSPKGDQRCSKCVHFLADSGSCRLVEGSIAPDGWCRLYSSAS